MNFDVQTRQGKVALANFLQAKIHRKKMNPLKYFVPNQPQMDLYEQISISKKTECDTFLLTCANRVGKSTGTFALIAAICTDNRSGVFELIPDWDEFGYPKNIWLIAKAQNLKENALEIFESYLPPKHIHYWFSRKDNQKFVSYYEFPETGFKIFVKTYDQDIDTFESSAVGLIIYDEPPPFAIWNACKGRLMQGGLRIIAATPLFGAGYLVDEVVEKSLIKDEDGHYHYWHREATMYENVSEKAGDWKYSDLVAMGMTDEVASYLDGKERGNNPLKEVERRIEEIDPDEYDARVLGKFMYLSGAVFKTYDRDIHCIEPFAISPEEYKIVMSVDPHNRRPYFITWSAVDHSGNWYVIDEYPRRSESNGLFFEQIKHDKHTTADVIKAIARIEHEWGFDRVDVLRVIDPNFGAQNVKESGRTVAEELTWISDADEHGIHYPCYFTPGNNDIEYGVGLIKQDLKTDQYGDPSFYIFNTCENTERSVRLWSYEDHKGRSADTKGLSEKVQDLYKDGCDTIRYARTTLQDNPVTFQETGWRAEWAEKGRSSKRVKNAMSV